MTNAMQTPFPSNEEYAADPVVLLRGGEALSVEPVADRFILSLAAGQTLSEIQLLFQGATLTPILDSFFEVQAEADRLNDWMQTLRQSDQAVFISPVYELQRSPGTFIYPTNQITIQFQESVASDRMQQIAAKAGLRILKLVAGVPKAFVFQIASSANPLQLAAALSRYPEIVLVEPNIAVMQQPCYRPRESEYGKQWYLHHEGGEALAAGSHIFAEAAWNLTKGKRSIAVAVVDTQINLNHPDFQSEGKIVAPVDLQKSQTLPTAQNNEHGTAVAQIAIADETGKGMIGVAPGCALMPIQIGQFIDDQTIEQISQWAIDKGADVLCCSWSAAAIYFPLSLRQRVALTQAATQGRDGRGCVIIFAAGNANRPIDGTINEQGWTDQFLQGNTRWLNGFAVHPDVITVAACNSLNQKSAASNWGNGIWVTAPGGADRPTLYTQRTGLLPTAPDLAAPPPGKSLEINALAASSVTSSETALPLGCTSAASAIVTGVVALMLSVNPDLTAQAVRQILQQTADRLIDRVPDPQLGLSLGDYDENRYSAWFGYGKVNAIKAVQMAQRFSMPFPLPYRWLSYVEANPLEIPDGDLQGISSTIQVPEAAPVCDIEVLVEVEHDFLGDLEIALIPPWGTAIPLQSRSLGRLTSLKTTYSLENTLWLKTVLNRSAQGNWQLKLVDAIPESRGHLRQWQLNLGV